MKYERRPVAAQSFGVYDSGKSGPIGIMRSARRWLGTGLSGRLGSGASVILVEEET
jgi:hypothetical protein